MVELLQNFSITEAKKKSDLESLNGMVEAEKLGASELINAMMISEEPWLTMRGVEILEELHAVNPIRVAQPACQEAISNYRKQSPFYAEICENVTKTLKNDCQERVLGKIMTVEANGAIKLLAVTSIALITLL